MQKKIAMEIEKAKEFSRVKNKRGEQVQEPFGVGGSCCLGFEMAFFRAGCEIELLMRRVG